VAVGGNLGVGTSSPAAKLHVSQTSNTTVGIQIDNGSNGNVAGSNIYLNNDAAGYSSIFQASSGGSVFGGSNSLNIINSRTAPITFWANDAERMRIDSSGNLLVGTTAQLNGAYGSKVNVQAGANNGIAVAGSAANWSALVVFNASNTLIGYLNATQSNISLVNVSDYRLKKNVTPLSGGLANISALTPVTYDWTNSDESGEGFIAHELQAVIPHAVTGEKDAVNEDGSVKPQGVDYSKIVVHLVAACQELSAKNDAFEARLAALEAK